MPQIDVTTLSVIIISSWLSTLMYYNLFSINILSEVVTLSKFRSKIVKVNSGDNLRSSFIPTILTYQNIIKHTKHN